MTYGEQDNLEKRKRAMVLFMRLGFHPSKRSFDFLMLFYDYLASNAFTIVSDADLIQYLCDKTQQPRSRFMDIISKDMARAFDNRQLAHLNTLFDDSVMNYRPSVMHFLHMLALFFKHFDK